MAGKNIIEASYIYTIRKASVTALFWLHQHSSSSVMDHRNDGNQLAMAQSDNTITAFNILSFMLHNYVKSFQSFHTAKTTPYFDKIYCKQQKLSERKVSQFTRFYPNVRKTFAVFGSFVLKKAIAQLNIC